MSKRFTPSKKDIEKLNKYLKPRPRSLGKQRLSVELLSGSLTKHSITYITMISVGESTLPLLIYMSKGLILPEEIIANIVTGKQV